jgi:mannose-6-phosphate isomerase-like protein (cupin superfamily)
LRPNCGIGIHRHRDNQEAFMLLSGKAWMVTGDWCEWPDRDRAFEIRTLLPGDLALIKGGQLHALLNPLDENITLFMFGGYD